mmetsp:Transcript_87544/g.245927  ORF Transcript_87544/g.245927 Transcript_87544/m.245927 type:complete len:284 (+) Transcript_87544:154-1005(+)
MAPTKSLPRALPRTFPRMPSRWTNLRRGRSLQKRATAFSALFPRRPPLQIRISSRLRDGNWCPSMRRKIWTCPWLSSLLSFALGPKAVASPLLPRLTLTTSPTADTAQWPSPPCTINTKAHSSSAPRALNSSALGTRCVSSITTSPLARVRVATMCSSTTPPSIDLAASTTTLIRAASTRTTFSALRCFPSPRWKFLSASNSAAPHATAASASSSRTTGRLVSCRCTCSTGIALAGTTMMPAASSSCTIWATRAATRGRSVYLRSRYTTTSRSLACLRPRSVT